MEKNYNKYIVDIQGKPYMTVAGRLAMFWDDVSLIEEDKLGVANGSIITEVTVSDKQVLTKAVATIGNRTATGWAGEVIGDGFINKTSAIENCESSAVGRALGNLGYGLLDAGGVASADEVQGAIAQQTGIVAGTAGTQSSFKKATDKQINYINKLRKERGEVPTDRNIDSNQASLEIERLLKTPNNDNFHAEDFVEQE